MVATAWLLAVGMGACGAVHGATDAGGDDDDDVAIDAAAGQPDGAPPTGTVTVTVYDEFNVPIGGVSVMFSAADGSQLDRVFTDDNGVAQADVPAGSTVTISRSRFDEFTIYHYLQTLVGVVPGDNIEIGPREKQYSYNPMGQLTVDFPTPVNGSQNFQLHVGCNNWGFGLGTYTLDLYEDKCTQGVSPVDVVGLAINDVQQPIAYDLQFGLELNGPNAVVFDNWSNDFQYVSAQASNAPPEMILVAPKLVVLHGGLEYELGNQDGQAITEGEILQFDVPFPPDFADRLHVSLLGMYAAGGDPSQVQGFAFVGRALGPGGLLGLDIDLTTDTMPRVLDVVSTVGTGDDVVDFSLVGDSSAATALAAGMSWRQSGGTHDIEWQWDGIAAPHRGPPIPLPWLPDDIVIDPISGDHAWPPPIDGTTENAAGILQIQPGDWGSFRTARPFDFFENPLQPEAPIGKTIRFTVGGITDIN